MTHRIWRFALLGLIELGLVAGCGAKAPQQEVKPDPALATKPFPKVGDAPKP